ncbi:MAG: isochorismate synthase [Thermoflavifilum sp.]|nr:isochorismate synthase [Thermoflavifilum sp.]MCL6514190.1 isochorismate synthase [Alicyclobacillus sp.]
MVAAADLIKDGQSWQPQLQSLAELAVQTSRARGRRAWACGELKLAQAPTLAAVVEWACTLPPQWPRWLWARPSEGQLVFGWGCAARFTATGYAAAGRLAEQLKTCQRYIQGLPAAEQTWLTGLAFAPGPRQAPWQGWPDAEVYLPAGLIEVFPAQVAANSGTAAEAGQMAREARLQLVAAATPGTSAAALSRQLQALFTACGGDAPRRGETATGLPDGEVALTRVAETPREWTEAAWQELVQETAAWLRTGEAEKVVLARFIRRAPLATCATAVLALADRAPDSVLFAVWRHGQCFFGATPERLLRVTGGELAVDCLAGTAPRGRTAAEDEQLSAALLASGKNRQEHGLVRDWLLTQLQPVAAGLMAPERPVLRKLADVQHLYTPLRGWLRAGSGVLAAAQQIHPTPAMAGVPQAAALTYIRAREGFDRGWYAGALGWLRGDGSEGELVVAIRSALASPEALYAFAGAGVLADSDPAAEWAETEYKLRTVLAALRSQEVRAHANQS